MNKPNFANNRNHPLLSQTIKMAGLLTALVLTVSNPVWSQIVDNSGSTSNTTSTTTVNTGQANGSILGTGNQSANGAGVGVNGSNTGNINNNQNNLTTGTNQNSNLVYVPNAASSSGGSSALILPRNPLPLSNAALGRSNFGLQFGVQNNPGLSQLTGGNGGLGWFMQGGLTIPFGKIPDVLTNNQNSALDDMRERRQQDQRNVFGDINNKNNQVSDAARKSVSGQVYGLNAYNYETSASPKIALATSPAIGSGMMSSVGSAVGAIGKLAEPKVMALEPATVFAKPFSTDKIGNVELGKEYPYLGHIHSGWVKILLPDGSAGWTKGNLEYLKYDYTEVDTLSSNHTPDPPAATAKADAVSGVIADSKKKITHNRS